LGEIRQLNPQLEAGQGRLERWLRKPPGAVESEWDQEDPDAAPPVRLQEHEDGRCGHEREADGVASHGDKQEHAGAEVSVPTTPLEGEQGPQARGKGGDVRDSEGRKGDLPGGSEEKQHQGRRQRCAADPRLGENEEEHGDERHPGRLDETERYV